MKKYLFIFIIILTVAACKESFNPPAVDANLNYLVVEGMINTGTADSTIIKLSRTTRLTSGVTLQAETRATVAIQSNDNAINRTLTEGRNGTYFSLPFYLDPAKKYRLRIRTSAGKEYLSDYVEAKLSPEIDEVRYAAESNGTPGVQIYASTHDSNNKSKYYKWDFAETYEFNSDYMSVFVVENRAFRPRILPAENIFTCWRTIASNNVILASTAKLSNDVVADMPIKRIPPRDKRFMLRYSIIVNQQVLTKEAFDFWEILKKNTEQVGSIFDSQPSQLQGNVHAVGSPNEVVIGYINAGTVSHKRIFITPGQLPREFIYNSQFLGCPLDTVYAVDYNRVFFSTNPKIPIETYGPPEGYTTSENSCIDCTMTGSNVKPSFWP